MLKLGRYQPQKIQSSHLKNISLWLSHLQVPEPSCRSIALKIFEYKSFLILLKWYALSVYKIKRKKFKLLSVKEGGTGVYKKPKTALKITLNRKTAIDLSQPKTEYKTITTEDLYSSIFKTAQ